MHQWIRRKIAVGKLVGNLENSSRSPLDLLFVRKQKLHLITILTLGILTLPGCANDSFCRIEGRALQFGIPLYQGVPSANYVYKSLGYVRGEYRTKFTDTVVSSLSNALENLADKAKTIGANAVVKIKMHRDGSLIWYDGEAVVFESNQSMP